MASDDFDRANAGTLGANWTAQVNSANAIGIASNRADPSTTSDLAQFWNATSFANNQYAQVAIYGLTSTGANSGLGVVVRCDTGTTDTFYRAVVNAAASNNVDISKFVAGAWTNLALRTQAWSDGDVLRFEAEGTTLRVYRNGAPLGADISDSAIAAGSPGICQSGPTATGTLDNWEGGNLDAAVIAWMTA